MYTQLQVHIPFTHHHVLTKYFPEPKSPNCSPSCPLPGFLNQATLAHSLAHSSSCGLWMLSCSSSRAEELWQTTQPTRNLPPTYLEKLDACSWWNRLQQEFLFWLEIGAGSRASLYFLCVLTLLLNLMFHVCAKDAQASGAFFPFITFKILFFSNVYIGSLHQMIILKNGSTQE